VGTREEEEQEAGTRDRALGSDASVSQYTNSVYGMYFFIFNQGDPQGGYGEAHLASTYHVALPTETSTDTPSCTQFKKYICLYSAVAMRHA
jgi:hypothetical protein